MGSLASKPKVPTASTATQIVYVPATTIGTSGTTPTTTTTTPTTAEVDAKTAAEARTSSLLSRDRSRFGTITTSLRGLLSLADNSDKRKTLLGE